ncbi:hypothetical protein [Streptomyces sp. CNQ085]|uniref:SCO2584 family spore wall biosynthesis protein n=1 Tax=Streptomyces sp. CNQ085 TaxID=2886944 RepID=UPI001F5107DA|nr:hypothetical protein [Streptomyces sp. CNQ085]MCI0383576.1 hypothetical protein [Streptomyces sp. CNQ085]
MPEDVGGQPHHGGEEPDDRDRAAADDVFASVVLDESFVRAALIHEPTAAERAPAAAQSPSETEAALAHDDQYGYGIRPDGPEGVEEGRDAGVDEDDDHHGRYRYGRLEFADRLDHLEYVEDAEYPEDAGYAAYTEENDGRAGPHGYPPRPYRGHVRWQRPVAWVLAVVMSVGIVAMAFAAVHRGASGQRQQPPPEPPPATSGVDAPPAGRSGALPSLSGHYSTSWLGGRP